MVGVKHGRSGIDGWVWLGHAASSDPDTPVQLLLYTARVAIINPISTTTVYSVAFTASILTQESNTDSKKAATDFLHKPNFHQNLRNEILFGLTPTTLKACVDQRQAINDVANTMLSGGFLREHGLKSLATILAFEAIIKKEVIFKCKTENITSFFQSGRL